MSLSACATASGFSAEPSTVSPLPSAPEAAVTGSGTDFAPRGGVTTRALPGPSSSQGNSGPRDAVLASPAHSPSGTCTVAALGAQAGGTGTTGISTTVFPSSGSDSASAETSTVFVRDSSSSAGGCRDGASLAFATRSRSTSSTKRARASSGASINKPLSTAAARASCAVRRNTRDS
ncbi:hypothetical protein D7W81_37630 [Corallococcus aberystwythensis]|uniref:Uncharacterized protein n=1 Tax=Corallococcus aberystwythensis TaxID=2316722 RepID=A0A3A8PHM9_9BACT|nr:hypothetical protein D7W81_37630 [Corallococcus aberystwythensis]